MRLAHPVYLSSLLSWVHLHFPVSPVHQRAERPSPVFSLAPAFVNENFFAPCVCYFCFAILTRHGDALGGAKQFIVTAECYLLSGLVYKKLADFLLLAYQMAAQCVCVPLRQVVQDLEH